VQEFFVDCGLTDGIVQEFLVDWGLSDGIVQEFFVDCGLPDGMMQDFFVSWGIARREGEIFSGEQETNHEASGFALYFTI
jgi:hypothetical protein